MPTVTIDDVRHAYDDEGAGSALLLFPAFAQAQIAFDAAVNVGVGLRPDGITSGDSDGDVSTPGSLVTGRNDAAPSEAANDVCAWSGADVTTVAARTIAARDIRRMVLPPREFFPGMPTVGVGQAMTSRDRFGNTVVFAGFEPILSNVPM